ncbi:hypothetical protein [Paraburkholderia sp. SIMBA_054]|uniref:hypothetical protein n=1 Tax=Paraburkholderia sp. SIMBA_054 TaxID=3085795 RepID=UPI0039798B79
MKLYLYSPGNLIGIALACIGPALLLAGVVDRGWWMISAAAYGAGWAAGALFFPNAVVEQTVEMSFEELPRFLGKLLEQHGSRIPSESFERIQSIHSSLEQALPRFQELFERSGTPGQQWMIFRQVVLSYLPETLNNYLRLPAPYAATHKVGGTGKTPRALLAEQLEVMDTELQRVVQTLFESDANQMLLNSRFLESKFGKAIDFAG